jgi:uncharacterized membrane protein
MDQPNNTTNSNKPSAPNVESHVLMGVLSYLGPLVIISYFMINNNSFVKFHVKQGLVLFIVEVIIWILTPMFWQLWTLIQLINLVVFVLSVIGIINVVQKKEKMLPVIGGFSSYFKF